MENPVVSIIITTKNSERTLERLLLSIKRQSYRKLEIILIDNNSSDSTVNIALRYTNFVYKKGPERSVQRNFGARKSKGRYLLILDSDMVLTKDVIKNCVNLIQKQTNIKEIIIPEKSFGVGKWSKAKILEREINLGEKYFESARFYDKKVFWEFNGFDETMTGPEDWDLPQRISRKYKVGRINSYIKHDEGKHSLIGLMKKKFYYGLSAHKYLKSQKLPIIGPTTIYFLRIGFYKKWRKLLKNPYLTLTMFIMLFAETLGGGVGYLVGRFKSE